MPVILRFRLRCTGALKEVVLFAQVALKACKRLTHCMSQVPLREVDYRAVKLIKRNFSSLDVAAPLTARLQRCRGAHLSLFLLFSGTITCSFACFTPILSLLG